MEIRYFTDTDTLLIDFSRGEIVKTKDIDENTLVEFDGNGELVSMTIEHAQSRIDVDSLSFHRFAEKRLLKDHPAAVVEEWTAGTAQTIADAVKVDQM
jgi:uncharacterized protein YuzE